MKKLVIAVLLLAGLTATAQTSHLTFKGIPIDGTLKGFVGKLKKKGMTCIETEQNAALLKGEFAAQKGCSILVIADESGDVYRIGVIFPEKRYLAEALQRLYDPQGYVDSKVWKTKICYRRVSTS